MISDAEEAGTGFPVVPAETRITAVTALEVRVPSLIASAEISSPMDAHPAHRHRRSSWYGMMSQVLVSVTSSDGRTGIGCTNGGSASVAVIEDHLAALLVGTDPSDIEVLADLCTRATIPYGPGGIAAMAVSGIELALWDLAGKRAGEPVYRLLARALGGQDDPPTAAPIPAYASGNEPERFVDLGFEAVKMSMRAGPWDGADGVRVNAGVLSRARKALGSDRDLMVDAWMGWDLDYIAQMSPLLADHNVRWLEEPLPPTSLPDNAEARRLAAPTALATGEHCHRIDEFTALLDTAAVDILQPDVSWCGGLTAAWRVWDKAERQGVTVVPHLSGAVWGLHLVAARPGAQLAEWYVDTTSDQEPGTAPSIFHGAPRPEAGALRPSDEPGFGVRIDPAAVERWGRRR
ncbi:enolase C-terminal domain-like protein [Actinomadura nitritigenes]|uniref:enolase C-terminal domain-like protein n=1 Tax=Actinomadura nitritigenes TaxID=134602 RepID=UPI003D90DBF9